MLPKAVFLDPRGELLTRSSSVHPAHSVRSSADRVAPIMRIVFCVCVLKFLTPTRSVGEVCEGGRTEAGTLRC